MALRRVSNYIRGFIQEWKEFNRVYQPMPDPPSSVSAPAAKKAFRLPPLTLKHLMKLSWKDHVDAIRMAGLMWYEQWKDPRSPAVHVPLRELLGEQDSESSLQKMSKELGIAESDLTAFTKKLQKNFRANEKRATKNVKELQEFVMEHREDLKEAARDRLALMNTSMQSFMEGYREAKDAEREKVLTDKHQIKELWDFVEQSLAKQKPTSPATQVNDAEQASAQQKQPTQSNDAASTTAEQPDPSTAKHKS